VRFTAVQHFADEEEKVAALVCDDDNGKMKRDFIGDDTLSVMFLFIVGRPKMLGIMVGMDQKDGYAGDEA